MILRIRCTSEKVLLFMLLSVEYCAHFVLRFLARCASALAVVKAPHCTLAPVRGHRWGCNKKRQLLLGASAHYICSTIHHIKTGVAYLQVSELVEWTIQMVTERLSSYLLESFGFSVSSMLLSVAFVLNTTVSKVSGATPFKLPCGSKTVLLLQKVLSGV